MAKKGWNLISDEWFWSSYNVFFYDRTQVLQLHLTTSHIIFTSKHWKFSCSPDELHVLAMRCVHFPKSSPSVKKVPLFLHSLSNWFGRKFSGKNRETHFYLTYSIQTILLPNQHIIHDCYPKNDVMVTVPQWRLLAVVFGAWIGAVALECWQKALSIQYE